MLAQQRTQQTEANIKGLGQRPKISIAPGSPAFRLVTRGKSNQTSGGANHTPTMRVALLRRPDLSLPKCASISILSYNLNLTPEL
ncbi:hypothetical protein SAMN05216323_100774 [Williamwhitmania taraxaci]|uniref:Uncharacterized protein n=1 Tax=Williamwhitmania taraxaci TaxID=1640674 RepID=A0A1G6H6N7_9BACT|nr:hypothetical protein SAMN05216323_100774 [Williamwhitmania taraxaci]